MLPNFHCNDFVVSLKIPARKYRIGQVVVANNTHLGIIIKRIHQIENGRYLFKGDNPESTSSEDMGWHEPEQLVGKVVCHVGVEGVRFLGF